MVNRVHVLLLRIYRRLPIGARRLLIRVLSPSFTVGAICLIEREDGAVLLVRQVYRARWGLPGGLLKRREDPAVAVRREVLEEIGVEIDLIGEPTPVVEARPQRVDLVYSARLADSDGPAPVPRSPEILDAQWFPRNALPELQHETTTALVALARSSRAARGSLVAPSPVDPVRDHV